MAETCLGDILKSLREVRGLSKVNLADSAGVSRGSLHTAESSTTNVLKPSTLSRILLGLATASPFSGDESDLLCGVGLKPHDLQAANDEASRQRAVSGEPGGTNRSAQERFDLAVLLLTRHGVDREGLIILEALAEQAVARSAVDTRTTDEGRRVYFVNGPEQLRPDGSTVRDGIEYTFEDEDDGQPASK